MQRVDSNTSDKVADMIATVEAGDAETLFDLGLIFATGDGAERDLIEAHKWFNLAAMAGSEAAKEERGDLAGELTPGEVAQALRAARQFLNGESAPAAVSRAA